MGLYRITHAIFFQWVNPVVIERSRSVINGLLKKIDRLEKEKETAERNNANMSRLKWILVAVVIVLCVRILG